MDAPVPRFHAHDGRLPGHYRNLAMFAVGCLKTDFDWMYILFRWYFFDFFDHCSNNLEHCIHRFVSYVAVHILPNCSSSCRGLGLTFPRLFWCVVSIFGLYVTCHNYPLCFNSMPLLYMRTLSLLNTIHMIRLCTMMPIYSMSTTWT